MGVGKGMVVGEVPQLTSVRMVSNKRMDGRRVEGKVVFSSGGGWMLMLAYIIRRRGGIGYMYQKPGRVIANMGMAC